MNVLIPLCSIVGRAWRRDQLQSWWEHSGARSVEAGSRLGTESVVVAVLSVVVCAIRAVLVLVVDGRRRSRG